MRWNDLRQSENVEDRRGGRRGGQLAVGGGLGGALVMLLVYLLSGDPESLQNIPQAGPARNVVPDAEAGAADDTLRRFVSAVLASTEDVWRKEFADMGEAYRDPHLVMFTDQVQSACGAADAAVGPFYCSGDSRVYIDLSFFRELRDRFRAPGDFAEAYVIAHEVGHHVQNLLGISGRVHGMSGRGGARANELSVRLELQADFLAGLWAHHAMKQGLLEPGDVEEALNAASAIGDDRLQREAQGYVVPDAFTHGTSEQRARWFRKGLETGDFRLGDTFGAKVL